MCNNFQKVALISADFARLQLGDKVTPVVYFRVRFSLTGLVQQNSVPGKLT